MPLLIVRNATWDIRILWDEQKDLVKFNERLNLGMVYKGHCNFEKTSWPMTGENKEMIISTVRCSKQTSRRR